MINGRVAARFLTPNGQLSPARRAEITVDRLRNLAAVTTDFGRIHGVATQWQGKVFGPQGIIFLVTAQEAKAQGSTVPDLTRKFADTIRWLLSLPPIQLGRASLVVPVTETRRIEVGGALLEPLTVTSSNPEAVTVELTERGRAVIVRGIGAGKTTVTVACREYQATAEVTAMRYAAQVIGPARAMVTGNPTPGDVCAQAGITAALRSLAIEPGARATPSPTKAEALRPGERQQMTVPVRAEGPGYLPLATNISVTVENVVVPRRQAAALMYSNNPERLTRYETLFAQWLNAGTPARLVYHHQNAIGRSTTFDIEIINTAVSPSQVHVISATPDPRVDTVLVGYRAGAGFMRDYLNNVGVILDIPRASRTVLYSIRLRPMETASGIMELAPLSGEPLLVHVVARTPDWPTGTANLPMPAGNGDGMLPMSDHLYSAPLKSVDARYSVGGPWSFIRIGKEAIRSSAGNGDKELYGNYGVMYEINVNVENPTAEARKVQVLFEPSAGIASGIFWIDGQIIGTTHRKPPDEFKLAGFTLAPNGKRSMLIRTIPLSGSNYPATILVRS